MNPKRVHRLEDWYLAPLLPILLGSVALGISRLSPTKAIWAVRGFIVATAIGFFLYSYLPPGANAQMYRYHLSPHHIQVTKMIENISDSQSIAAQDQFLAHLANRPTIYRYPWFSKEKEQALDYYVLDRTLSPYPLDSVELGYAIDNLVADPNNVIIAEMDGAYLIRRGGTQNPSIPVNLVAEDTIKLERVEVAVTDTNGWFQFLSPDNIALTTDQTIRVTLYWEALAPPKAERTVSVRVVDASGGLLAQQDMLPNHGARPTSWWQTGWAIRDTYYLTLAPQAQPGKGTLDVLLYDTYTQEGVPFEDNLDAAHIAPVTIIPAK